MDPEVYPDPKEFKPSRWNVCYATTPIFHGLLCSLESMNFQGLAPKAGTFLPFGGGSRLCPGNDLAKLEISVFLHYFLLDYK